MAEMPPRKVSKIAASGKENAFPQPLEDPEIVKEEKMGALHLPPVTFLSSRRQELTKLSQGTKGKA